ncbi:MAG: outer membrane protein assembly factor BamE [Xanthomonadaceae bacterium]|nr:outer membrane protein assembly factor BamE [Xanthomonadaceae bacterium]
MRRIPVFLLVVITTASCGILYRQPIYQGNLVNQEAVDQLRTGLTKQQVTALLGTPSIADPFHAQRWDYAASQRINRRGTTEVKNLALHFDDDILMRWEGDYFPNQDAFLAKASVRQFGRNLGKEKRRRR